MKKSMYLFSSVAVFLLVACHGDMQPNSSRITNFKECLAAGYPVMESYPRQCRVPGGQTFIEEIEATAKPNAPKIIKKYCRDLCGDGTCQEMVCEAEGCPCSETESSCSKDCGEGVVSAKRYISENPKQCATMRFVCEAGERAFFDEKGCGCESTRREVIGSDEQKFCTAEYAPVCGKVSVQCIKAPCDPVEQTFSNRCVAEQAGAKVVREGECGGQSMNSEQ